MTDEAEPLRCIRCGWSMEHHDTLAHCPDYEWAEPAEANPQDDLTALRAELDGCRKEIERLRALEAEAREMVDRMQSYARTLGVLWRHILEGPDRNITDAISHLSRCDLIDYAYEARNRFSFAGEAKPSPEHLLEVALQHVLRADYAPGAAAYTFRLIDNAPPYEHAEVIERALRARPFSPPYSPRDPHPGSYIDQEAGGADRP